MRSFNPSGPIVTLILAAVMTVPVVACSGDDGPGQSEESLVAECQAISDVCHHADQMVTEIAMCHATAHENDAAQCTSVSAMCIETCHGGHEADGGHEEDGGGTTGADSGAAGDSGP